VLGQPLSKNRIDKISETDPSAFWQGAEQKQDQQNLKI